MNPEVQVTVEIDETVHLRLWQMIFVRSIGRCLVIYGTAIAVVILLFASSGSSATDLLYGLIGGALAISAMLGVQWLALPLRAQRVFKESAQLRTPKQFIATDQGFRFVWDRGNIETAWSEITKWDETDDLLAIFPNRLMAYMLPKCQVDEPTINFVRERMVASGLTLRGKLRK